MRTSPSARRRLAGFTAAALAATGLLALGTTQTQASPSPKPTDAKIRVHWSNGKALGHLKKTPPGQAVKSYLATQLGDATADDGRVMYSRSDQQSSAALKAPGDGFGHLATIPLRDVVPGRYVLKIEARSSAGGAAAVRELEFTVR